MGFLYVRKLESEAIGEAREDMGCCISSVGIQEGPHSVCHYVSMMSYTGCPWQKEMEAVQLLDKQACTTGMPRFHIPVA